MTDAALAAIVQERFAGDRTAACLAAAVVDAGADQWSTSRAFVCADPSAKRKPAIDARATFEIGSITGTMTAALLAA